MLDVSCALCKVQFGLYSLLNHKQEFLEGFFSFYFISHLCFFTLHQALEDDLEQKKQEQEMFFRMSEVEVGQCGSIQKPVFYAHSSAEAS